MEIMRNFILGIIFTIVVFFAGGYCCVKQGYLDLRADQEPTPTERRIDMSSMDT
jgi:hypothetical protein